ncbi:DegV family protein [Acholeplasma sp. OttesenSCG-928-E16]|nr:DegV family protein [Acholeplasma sp. OttesenSCG-928-E16]
MKKYVILTDSCSDLGKDIREKYNIEYIPLFMSYLDKTDVLCDLDWSNFKPKDFYNMMRDGVVFKTSQVNVELYAREFKKYVEEGYDVLSLTTSSALSGSINSSRIAREMVLEEHKDAKIYCIDTLRGALGEGLIVYYAAQLREAGKSIDEVAAWVEENKLNINQIGSVESLTYLKRAGRVTGSAAFMANLFNIKPIIYADAKGQNVTFAKVRGRKPSIKECIKVLKDRIIDPSNQVVFIAHADCLDDANYIKNVLLEEVKVKDVYINWIGPTIGASVGPGMFGIYYYGQKVEEKFG